MMIKPEVGKTYRVGPFWPTYDLDLEEWAEGICTGIIDSEHSHIKITKEAPCRFRLQDRDTRTHNSNIKELNGQV